MRRFEAVLFDFGGVFTESPFAVFEDAAAELGAAPADVLDVVFGPYDRDTDHPWHRLERGELPLLDAREAIIALGVERGIRLDPLKILARMGLSGGLREGFVARAHALRAEGYQVALVTNNVREFSQRWRSLLPVDEIFHAVIDSSEVGERKPSPGIYERALDAVGAAAQDAVFLDDAPGNIEAARRLGMQTVLVGDPAPALAELDRILGR